MSGEQGRWTVYMCDVHGEAEPWWHGPQTPVAGPFCVECSMESLPKRKVRSIPVVPCDEEAVERAAKALYEGPDELGRERPEGVTWETMLTYDGRFPENTDHPIADEYRRMARAALRAAGAEKR